MIHEAVGSGKRVVTLRPGQAQPPAFYRNRLPRPADASSNALNAIFEEMFENPVAHHGSTDRLKLSHV